MESDTIADTTGTTTVCSKFKEVSGILPVDVATYSRAVKHYKVQNSSLVHSGKKSKAEANTMLIVAITMLIVVITMSSC